MVGRSVSPEPLRSYLRWGGMGDESSVGPPSETRAGRRSTRATLPVKARIRQREQVGGVRWET